MENIFKGLWEQLWFKALVWVVAFIVIGPLLAFLNIFGIPFFMAAFD